MGYQVLARKWRPSQFAEIVGQEHVRRAMTNALNREGLKGVTILVALHDLGIATAHFDRLLLLNRTILGIGSPTAVLTPPVLERAYGSCLRMVQTENGTLVVQDTACSGGET